MNITLAILICLIAKMDSVTSMTTEIMNISLNDTKSLTNQTDLEEGRCLRREMKCQSAVNDSTVCIGVDKRCDGTTDCSLGEDEADCLHKTCSPNQVMCEDDTKKCIPHEWVCDGSSDCGESNWDESTELCHNTECPQEMFRCSTGRCIPTSWMCDSTPDCPNFEDEPESCHKLSNQKKAQSSDSPVMVLYDFTTIKSLNSWEEQSDSVREVGKSKGTMVVQKTRVFQRAVFFSMLNPQPNGACFAGYRTDTQFDLSHYTAIEVRARGQGDNYGYKINLRHRGLNSEPHPTYEHMFQAPKDEFDTVKLLLSGFEPYYRGRKLNISEVGPLDTSNITNFEVQIYGGVYLPIKQKGTSSLEIDWVRAVK